MYYYSHLMYTLLQTLYTYLLLQATSEGTPDDQGGRRREHEQSKAGC